MTRKTDLHIGDTVTSIAKPLTGTVVGFIPSNPDMVRVRFKTVAVRDGVDEVNLWVDEVTKMS
jgi:hypothetical protein